MIKKENIEKVLDILEATYPNAECALDHRNVFELIVAVSLSAQTTDKSVNQVTPALFEKYPTAFELAKANPDDVAGLIKRIGMYKQKSHYAVAMAKRLVENFNGEVPNDYYKLITLPGVGRKTANVVLSVGFGEQRIAVDTHVFRVANRIGLTKANDVLDTEMQLMKNIPESRWTRTHHLLIFHGRNCCDAKKPACETCPIADLCEKNIKK